LRVEDCGLRVEGRGFRVEVGGWTVGLRVSGAGWHFSTVFLNPVAHALSRW
jgi:hypothetical protein